MNRTPNRTLTATPPSSPSYPGPTTRASPMQTSWQGESGAYKRSSQRRTSHPVRRSPCATCKRPRKVRRGRKRDKATRDCGTYFHCFCYFCVTFNFLIDFRYGFQCLCRACSLEGRDLVLDEAVRKRVRAVQVCKWMKGQRKHFFFAFLMQSTKSTKSIKTIIQPFFVLSGATRRFQHTAPSGFAISREYLTFLLPTFTGLDDNYWLLFSANV